VLLIPELLILSHARTDQINWIGHSQDNPFKHSIEFITRDAGALMQAAALAAFAILACSCWRRAVLRGRDRTTWRSLLLVSWALGPMLLALTISIWRPILVHRYLLVSVPAWALIAAGALRLVTMKQVYRLVVAAPVVIQLGALYAYETSSEIEPWRNLAHAVSTSARPGDGVAVLPGYQRMTLEYYLEADPRTPRLVAASPTKRWGSLPLYGGDDFPVRNGQELRALVEKFNHVWLILDPSDPSISARTPTVRQDFARFKLVSEHRFGRLILRQYARRTQPSRGQRGLLAGFG
jgi:hypothetical protein